MTNEFFREGVSVFTLLFAETLFPETLLPETRSNLWSAFERPVMGARH